MTSPLRLAGTSGAIAYAWRELLRRAGEPDADRLPARLVYGHERGAEQGPVVVIRPSAPSALVALLDGTLTALPTVEIAAALPYGARTSLSGPLPILFQGAGAARASFAERLDDETIIVHADLIAATLFMLTRCEETASVVRDEHGRFPARESAAYRLGFLGRPIIDEYALLLREWLRSLLPGWAPAEHRFVVRPSHDVDSLHPFRTIRSALRGLAGELLLRKGGPVDGARLLGNALAEVVQPRRATNLRGVYELARLSRRHQLASAFYFMAAEPGPLEGDYRLDEPAVRECIARLRAEGFEVGLHPGYHTLGDTRRLLAEKARLDQVLGETAYGGRQHFLRFRAPETWRDLEKAGLTYDSTLGYADHEGFRCGTCHPFRPFDLGRDRELSLWERPLIVMDVTLRNYRGLSASQAEERLLDLAAACRRVGGTFTVLWHNTSLAGSWAPWAEAYRRALAACAGGGPELQG